MHVRLQHLSKAYEGRAALADLDLDIAPGQIVALLGSNGAGKTTLLRCLAGIVVPDTGEIRYDGALFRRDRIDLRRRFSFLPDLPFVHRRMSVARQIGMVLKLYEADRPGVEERVVELLRDFDLLAEAETKMTDLSRGQAYKAALVALLAVDPELWLLDEPFASGMDPRGLTALRRHARAAAGRGRTILYSTQILEVAETFSDRVCILQRGRLHAFPQLGELRQRATNGGTLEEVFQQLHEEGS